MQHHRPNLEKKQVYENGSMDDKIKWNLFILKTCVFRKIFSQTPN